MWSVQVHSSKFIVFIKKDNYNKCICANVCIVLTMQSVNLKI